MSFTLDQIREGHQVTATAPNMNVTGKVVKLDADPALPGVEVTDDKGDTHWVPVDLITERVRPLSEIAAEIRADWKKVNYAAEPYLAAMAELASVTDSYGADDAKDIVTRFLLNARTWRGGKAPQIKAELRALIGQ